MSTAKKFNILKDSIGDLRVKDKRCIYLLMRTSSDDLNVDTFFPHYGFTAGEFAVGQVLCENRKTASTSTSSSSSASSSSITSVAVDTSGSDSFRTKNQKLKRRGAVC